MRGSSTGSNEGVQALECFCLISSTRDMQVGWPKRCIKMASVHVLRLESLTCGRCPPGGDRVGRWMLSGGFGSGGQLDCNAGSEHVVVTEDHLSVVLLPGA